MNLLNNFTPNYLKALNAVTNASVNFSVQPCKEMAIILTEAKIALEKLEVNVLKFTLEYRQAKQQATVNSLVECLVDGGFRK
jgi:hypothetical protein|tara:strand:+ start:120 stop:365 length:246 start_codon:yes stop_codon:yes gene_type:complete